MVKEEELIRLGKNDARTFRWTCNIRPGDKISAEKLRIRQKLNSMVECLQDGRLLFV